MRPSAVTRSLGDVKMLGVEVADKTPRGKAAKREHLRSKGKSAEIKFPQLSLANETSLGAQCVMHERPCEIAAQHRQCLNAGHVLYYAEWCESATFRI